MAIVRIEDASLPCGEFTISTAASPAQVVALIAALRVEAGAVVVQAPVRMRVVAGHGGSGNGSKVKGA